MPTAETGAHEILRDLRYNSRDPVKPLRAGENCQLWFASDLTHAPRNYMHMEPEEPAPLTAILEHVPAGIALLDDTSLSVLYANSYLSALLNQP